MLKQIGQAVLKLRSPIRAKQLQKFLKTGPGEYAQGDIFIGLTNPQSRSIATAFKNLSYTELDQLIKSKIHEQRFIALVILVNRFKKEQQKCQQFYLHNLDYINNWDLVDSPCYKIVGEYLLERKQKINMIKQLAESGHLWRKRIAIVSTFAFIKKGQNSLTYDIAKLLLKDQHDLIHKAVGWMLRKTGKNDEQQLKQFLRDHYDDIPRTCLRYSIEKFEQSERIKYLKKQF